jgi:hypothetical protein
MMAMTTSSSMSVKADLDLIASLSQRCGTRQLAFFRQRTDK